MKWIGGLIVIAYITLVIGACRDEPSVLIGPETCDTTYNYVEFTVYDTVYFGPDTVRLDPDTLFVSDTLWYPLETSSGSLVGVSPTIGVAPCPVVITVTDTNTVTVEITFPSDTIKPPPVTHVTWDTAWVAFEEGEVLDWTWLIRTRVWTVDDDNKPIPDTLVGYAVYARVFDSVETTCWYTDEPERFSILGCGPVFISVGPLPGEPSWPREGECETLRTYWGNPLYGPNMERPPVDEYPGDAWWCRYDVLPYAHIFQYLPIDAIGRITIEGFDAEGERIMRWQNEW